MNSPPTNTWQQQQLLFVLHTEHHWVCVLVTPAAQLVEVVDSMAPANSKTPLPRAICHNVAVVVSLARAVSSETVPKKDAAAKQAAAARVRADHAQIMGEWRFVRLAKRLVPQQNNVFDCGIFAIGALLRLAQVIGERRRNLADEPVSVQTLLAADAALAGGTNWHYGSDTVAAMRRNLALWLVSGCEQQLCLDNLCEEPKPRNAP